MMYSLLVAEFQSRRKPLIVDVEADDEAEAAFFAWLDRGGADRPHVYPVSRSDADRRWRVSDGRRTLNVQIVSERN